MSEEEKAPEVPAEAAPDKKEENKIEAFYKEARLKSGEIFLKRKKGNPRLRKIVSKNNQAQLYLKNRNEWVQISALPKSGPAHGLKWHVQNKWQKIEKAEAEK